MNTSTKQKLDELDFQIMTHLIDNGRKSLTEIAASLGVAVATVRTRVTRLLDDQTLLVLGRVDPNRVGFNAYARIHVAVRPAQMIGAVASQIATLPEVTFLASIADDFDLEVNVMCRDNNHLNELMHQRLHKIDGVYRTKTTMYLKVYKIAQADLRLLNGAARSK